MRGGHKKRLLYVFRVARDISKKSSENSKNRFLTPKKRFEVTTEIALFQPPFSVHPVATYPQNGRKSIFRKFETNPQNQLKKLDFGQKMIFRLFRPLRT